MTKHTYRKSQSFLAIITLIVLMASFYFQYALGMQPCPLCLMQRLCVFLLLGIFGLSLATLRKAHWVSLLQVLIASAGLYFSLRQIWLQSLPMGEAPACMPSLDMLIHYFPWQDVARALFWGTGDCAAKEAWSLLGITMPGWAALYFVFMAITGLILYFRTYKSE